VIILIQGRDCLLEAQGINLRFKDDTEFVTIRQPAGEEISIKPDGKGKFTILLGKRIYLADPRKEHIDEKINS